MTPAPDQGGRDSTGPPRVRPYLQQTTQAPANRPPDEAALPRPAGPVGLSRTGSDPAPVDPAGHERAGSDPAGGGPAGGGPAPADGVGQDPGAGLRPFVLTSGRVDAADPDIGLETQVSSHPGTAMPRLPPESRAIVALCAQPMSVAEISARLRLHLGVTRILVGDLRAAGHLDVHVLDERSPDPDTILRVIRGLRAIS